MSFSASWESFLNLALAKQPFDVLSTITHLVPAFSSYIAFAILTMLPGTRTLRIGLWPLIALLAYRAAACVDLSNGNPKNSWLNVDFAVIFFNYSGKELSTYSMCSLPCFASQYAPSSGLS